MSGETTNGIIEEEADTDSGASSEEMVCQVTPVSVGGYIPVNKLDPTYEGLETHTDLLCDCGNTPERRVAWGGDLMGRRFLACSADDVSFTYVVCTVYIYTSRTTSLSIRAILWIFRSTTSAHGLRGLMDPGHEGCAKHLPISKKSGSKWRARNWTAKKS